MITTKEIKIKVPDKLSSGYIEEKLKQKGYDVLRWAITDVCGEYYTLNISVVE